eukprot:evm.model.scf_3273.1 EVM.evm.TU.scf_3273.1   scf_3273:2645-3037(+)
MHGRTGAAQLQPSLVLKQRKDVLFVVVLDFVNTCLYIQAEVEIRPKNREPISEVLFVGGATRMPAVRRFVRNMTGLDPGESAVDPDMAVALGAAIQAASLSGEVEDLLLVDVWQVRGTCGCSLGVPFIYC